MNKIEWTDITINPIVGCSKISDGCKNCYAEKFAWRHAHNSKLSEEVREAYKSVVSNGKWNGKTRFVKSAFDDLKTWKKPRQIFVGSMCDVFHKSVKDEWQHQRVHVATKYPRHTFMFLTKRPENMNDVVFDYFFHRNRCSIFLSKSGYSVDNNIWLGATVESQKYVDRIDDLIRIPASVRFISVEPMLSEITIPPEKLRQLQWVIGGFETGIGARSFPDAINAMKSLQKQCGDAGVPFFFKKWGRNIFNRTTIVNSPQNGAYVKSIDNDGEIDGKICREFPNG